MCDGIALLFIQIKSMINKVKKYLFLIFFYTSLSAGEIYYRGELICIPDEPKIKDLVTVLDIKKGYVHEKIYFDKKLFETRKFEIMSEHSSGFLANMWDENPRYTIQLWHFPPTNIFYISIKYDDEKDEMTTAKLTCRFKMYYDKDYK